MVRVSVSGDLRPYFDSVYEALGQRMRGDAGQGNAPNGPKDESGMDMKLLAELLLPAKTHSRTQLALSAK